MTLNASGTIRIGGSTVGESINLELGLSQTTSSSLNSPLLRALGRQTSGSVAFSNFYGKSSGFKQGIFGFGSINTGPSFMSNITNIVSSAGVVASDVSGVGSNSREKQASTFGGDKGIFGFGLGYSSSTFSVNNQNIVSNTGVLASDTFASGPNRIEGAGAGFGNDKGLFAFGRDFNTGQTGTLNLISNTGVVSTATASAGSSKTFCGAATYGYDKAIFGFGTAGTTNLVSNTGVIASDTAGVTGTRQVVGGAATFGVDRAIFGFGTGSVLTNITNLVSNTGVVASDTAGVGTAGGAPAVGYGGSLAMFGFKSNSGGFTSITNLVSSTGVVASDTVQAGSPRRPAGTSFGQ